MAQPKGASTGVRPPGKVSTTVTPVAWVVPSLPTSSRNVAAAPTGRGPAPSVRALARVRSTAASADPAAPAPIASATPRSTMDLLSVRIRRTLHHLARTPSYLGRDGPPAECLADAQAGEAGDRAQAAVLVAAVDPPLPPAVRAGRPDGRGRRVEAGDPGHRAHPAPRRILA